jgi:hypothetical protein
MRGGWRRCRSGNIRVMKTITRMVLGAAVIGALGLGPSGVATATAQAYPEVSVATKKPWYPPPGPGKLPLKRDNWAKGGWNPHCVTGPNGFVQFCR